MPRHQGNSAKEALSAKGVAKVACFSTMVVWKFCPWQALLASFTGLRCFLVADSLPYLRRRIEPACWLRAR